MNCNAVLQVMYTKQAMVVINWPRKTAADLSGDAADKTMESEATVDIGK